MKVRIISGAVAIVLLVVLVMLHTMIVFNIALGLIAMLMVYELARAEKLDKDITFTAVSALYAFVCPVAVYFLKGSARESGEFVVRFQKDVSDISVLLFPYIAATFAYIVIVTAILLVRHKSIPLGGFYTCCTYNALISLCLTSLCGFEKYFGERSVSEMVFVFMGAWVADSGAYFAGTFLGKHKLCPEISPKKTVEGLIGGAVANAVVFAAYAMYLNTNLEADMKYNIIGVSIAGVICCFLGLLGDLTASLIKRECGIKDYGNIMPGHGGALDRFDSLIYIAPFWLMINIL